MADRKMSRWLACTYASGVLALVGCGSDGGGGSDLSQDVPAPPQAQAASPPATSPASGPATAGTSAPVPQTPTAPVQPPASPPADPEQPSGAAGSPAPAMDPAVPPAMDPPAVEDPSSGPVGPEDGDPSAPVVETAEVACGGPSGGFGSGLANFMLDGREMIVSYPCGKHAGAPMTFFLNLHGTTPVSQHFYQHGYFAIHDYAASHNIITVTPSSVVEQWGNGDGGEDEPHLMAIIDWVYATFHGEGKFDIRGMWVGGHSWGAMYTTSFVCKPELSDKVVGAVIMSGIGRNPACASSISVISSAAESDIGPVVAQGNVPAEHGCGAAQMNMVGNNEETHWPDCDPGFAHANYFMLGKSHASSIDAVVVERIADLINVARR